MKSTLVSSGVCSILGLALTLSTSVPAWSQGTTFTYQGQLTVGGNPALGGYDFRSRLYDGTGALVAGPITNSAVVVSNGLFTMQLNFGAVFDGNARWLDIGVRSNGVGAFTTLTPRQELTPAPGALFAASAGVALTATTATSVGAGAVNTAGLQSGAVNSAAIADGTIASADLSSALLNSTFWRLAGNAGTTPGANYLGTTDNKPLELKVNSTRALRLEPTTDSPNVIGGFSANYVSNAVGVAIAGGGAGGAANVAVDALQWIPPDYGVVGGGLSNSLLGGRFATIGGGASNSISSLTSYGGPANSSTIGGGERNAIKGHAQGTIGGGGMNLIQMYANYGTIGGGSSNTLAYSTAGTIGGGSQNLLWASQGTIGGGLGNFIGGGDFGPGSAYAAVIGGGAGNIIQGGANESTISGGYSNLVGEVALYATVAGGFKNHIGTVANRSAIGGGSDNTIGISAEYAVIPGGRSNSVGMGASYALAAGRRAKASHPGSFVWADSTDSDFATTGTNQFLVRASGGIGINTPSPDAVLDVYGVRSISATSDGIVNIGNSGSAHVTLDNNEIHARSGSSPASLFINDFGGNIYAGGQLNVVFDSGVGIGTSSLAGYKFYVSGTAYSTGGWSGSDARWKKNVQPVTAALQKVKALQGVTYEWRRDEFPDRGFDDAMQLGFIAQDVERVVPEAVKTDADGYKAIAYEKLTAVLTEGMKEQQHEIDSLKTQNHRLEQTLAELQAVVTKLTQQVNGGAQ